MHVVELTCEGFRCLNHLCFRPAAGLNIIHGDNAQGKTSVLEAILFAATSKSHRTNVEGELVRHGAEGFRLDLGAERRDRPVRIEASWRQGAKRFKVNGVAQSRVSDILGKISVVLFSPEDVLLVKGTASHRRKFLDMELSQLLPAYLNALQQYRQVLRQRNELLRSGRADETLLDVWDEQLAKHGAALMGERSGFVAQLGALSARVYHCIAGDEELRVDYRPDVGLDQSLIETLTRTRKTDIRRGMTTRGPHRDDFELAVTAKNARSFASQGQQKTAALAIKIAELELVRGRAGEYPILMLDEVLSELDNVRSKRLFDAIDNHVQCLLTTTDPDETCASCGGDVSHFEIVRGHLEKR